VHSRINNLLYGFAPNLFSALAIADLAASPVRHKIGYASFASVGVASSTPPASAVRSPGEGVRSLAPLSRLTGTDSGTLLSTQTSTGSVAVLLQPRARPMIWTISDSAADQRQASTQGCPWRSDQGQSKRLFFASRARRRFDLSFVCPSIGDSKKPRPDVPEDGLISMD
jgi:hypothetical protein